MRPRQFTCLLTGAAALLFVVHVQFRPEIKQPIIVKPKPEPNRYQHAHPKAPAFKEPPAPTLAVPSASADGTLGALGVEAYTGGSPYDCTPSHVPRGTRTLDLIAPAEAEWPTNCEVEDNGPLCAVLRKTAVQREVLTAVCNANVIGQLEKWVDANRRSGITNMVIIAIDSKLPTWLEANNVPYWHKVQSAQGSHKISAQKFKFVRQFLSTGTSVLMTDIDVVYLQNPFLFLHKDADIEGTTDGWDDGSAYGWMEQLDDASIGSFGRFRPAMRITAWNSGLWYARATHASLRLMTILAYRMEHEDTWDQAAFGEEVARPARDDHLAAGITKRALNHWCFANSKTLFRRVRVEKALAAHKPVVVHANYHQPKEPRMRAVFDRWHLGQADALDRFARSEQAYTVPAPQLERAFQHSINDGFVSGANLRDASLAIAAPQGCAPRASKHGVAVTLHTLPRTEACAAGDALCAAARRVASSSRNGELVLIMAGQGDEAPLALLLRSAAAAGVANLLLVCTEPALCEGDAARSLPPAAAKLAWPAAPGAAALRAKYAVLAAVLATGVGVLSTHVATVLLQDPFASLYRDADIEAMSSGWDDGSAYGYNHVIDDPAMGFTRFCHGSRIVAYEPGLFYAAPTTEAVAFALRMELQLERHAPAASTPTEVAVARERELFLSELWLPSHHNYTSVGAVLRVMNYLCFANSKVLFRHLRHAAAATRPVLVHLAYHSDVVPRMEALLQKYNAPHDEAPLKALPLADTSTAHADAHSLECDAASREGAAARLGAEAGRRVVDESPWAWGGVTGLAFHADGTLDTPWGKGVWGGLPDAPQHVFADFAGSRHNVRVPAQGLGVSTRCGDSNIVLVRSMKGV